MSEPSLFRAWGVQKQILKSEKRIIGAFGGKRSGKTEIGAIKSILWQESKPNARTFFPYSVDPYLGVIISPTFDMLRRLSWKKFHAYAKPFIKRFNLSTYEAEWYDNSIVYGMSADRPERIEGIKAAWIWLDEVLQMSEQTFLECRARLSDSKGYLLCTGSLGVQFINPKQHWAYRYFKENPTPDTECFEWSTFDNPYFPKEELETFKQQLDPVTFRSMYELNWDTSPKNAVYEDFGNDNIISSYSYNPHWPTYVSIDWGYAHEMAVCFFQVSPSKQVFLFDEIVQSRMTLEDLYQRLYARQNLYNITDWCCDIAGNQEREQTGFSNVKWFKQKNIHLKYRSDSILNGISLVRSYIKNLRGERRFYVVQSCKKSIDGLKQ